MSSIRRLLPAAVIATALLWAASSHGRIQLDNASVASWADEYLGAALAQHRIAAAVLSVVQDGEIVFIKGYGHADYARGLPVDPATTRLRVCSNSKIFTATALLQLADRGLIRSLDDPANRYLERFQLPAPFAREITVRDLLTHRAGFAAAFFSEGTLDEIVMPLPGAVYDRLLAGLVNEPGTVSVYANSALAVQGAIIEDLSGLPFAQYVHENIFVPLGMRDSLIHASPEPPPRLAVPYRFYPSGAVERVPFVTKHPAFAPSGGVITTGADMAKFLIAQADEGRRSAQPLLAADTFRRMHTQQVTNHALLSGFGLQYFTSHVAGERAAAHDCGLPGFSTAHEIYPDSDAGVFIALLSAPLRPTVWERFAPSWVRTRMSPDPSFSWAERLTVTEAIDDFRIDVLGFPRPVAASRPDVGRRHQLAQYAGRYLDDGRPVGNMLSFPAALLEAAGSVGVESGGLTIFGDGPYHEIAADVFQHASNGDRVAFARAADGTVASATNRYTAFRRIGFFDDPYYAVWAFIVCVVLALPGLATLTRARSSEPAFPAAVMQSAQVLCLSLVVWCMFFGFRSGSTIENLIDYINAGRTMRLWTISVAMNLFFLSTLAMLWIAGTSWRGDAGPAQAPQRLQRLHYAALALAGCLTWPFLWKFHLLGLDVP